MSAQLTILGSGSSGNCAYIEADSTRLLVDGGLSARQIVERLALIGKKPTDLHAILVTHEHSDHTQGLLVLCRKFKIPIYANRLTRAAILESWMNTQKTEKSLPILQLDDKKISVTSASPEPNARVNSVRWRLFESGQRFVLGDFDVEPFIIPHDASDPVGFLLHYAGQCIGFLTDLGHMNHLTIEKAGQADVLVLETNHDMRMLQNDSQRPWAVKQRIAGRHGHLSNEAAATALAKLMSNRLRHVYLAHLSQECNRPELAEETIRKKLMEIGASHIRITVTFQDQPCEPARLESQKSLLPETPSLFNQLPIV